MKTPFVQGPKRPGNAGKSQQTNHHTDQPDDPQIQGPVYSPVGGHEIATKTQTKHTTQIGTSFCSILRPLLVTLLHPLVAEFAVSILSLEDANLKLPVCPTPAGCVCSNSGATVEQFAQRASETGEQSFAMGTSADRGEDAGVPRAPFKQC